MRAARSIPWPMGLGYAYGAACHALAGGEPTKRDEAATTAALAAFLVGFFDHLMDNYPQEFGSLGSLITESSLSCWAEGRDLERLSYGSENSPAAGFAALYRLYFLRCYQLMGGYIDSPVTHRWLDALKRMHRSQGDSAAWRMSRMSPSAELIEEVETPGTYAYWVIALSTCLGMDESAVRKMEDFAKKFTRLLRLTDGITDIDLDVQKDTWSGLTVRLALEAATQAQADALVEAVADECVTLLRTTSKMVEGLHWQSGDEFSLADILWAYIWVSLGGNFEVKRDVPRTARQIGIAV